MSIKVTILGPCRCGSMPKIGDVGGNLQKFEICCPKCGRAVIAETITAAIDMWDRVRLITGEQVRRLF